MRFIGRWLVSLALIPVSFVAGWYILKVVDKVAGVFVADYRWDPTKQALLFPPRTVDHWKTHDYDCTEIINNMGFRDRDFSVTKTAAFRIVAIGDSYTYGWGVDIEACWVKRVENYLRGMGLDVEILNLGKPGAGPVDYAAVADAAIPVFHPDLVLLGVLSGEDLQQVGGLNPKESFPNLVLVMKHLLTKPSPPENSKPNPRTPEDCRQQFSQMACDDFSRFWWSKSRRNFFVLETAVRDAYFDGMVNPNFISGAAGEPEYYMNTVDLNALKSPIQHIKPLFARIKRVADRHSAGIMALSIPLGIYVNKETYANFHRVGYQVTPEMQTTDVPEQAIGEACRYASIPFHSVLNEFRQHADKKGLYFEFDGHMTAAGHELFAKSVLPEIARYVQTAIQKQPKP